MSVPISNMDIVLASGMSGEVKLNSAGDRESQYELRGTLSNGSVIVVAKTAHTGGDTLPQVRWSG